MPHVLIIRFILVGLICVTPAILLADGPVIYGLVAASMAVAVPFIAWMRPGETSFLLSILRPVAAVAAIPAAWIFVQLLPLPAFGVAHPIWQSAAAALGHPIAGSITIDTGASLLVLARYLTMFAVFISSLSVATDRGRATWILYALMFATTPIAAIAICHNVFGFTFAFGDQNPIDAIEATNCAALGAIFAITAGVRATERHSAERTNSDAQNSLFGGLLPSFAAFAICLVALASAATTSVTLATAFGIAILMAVVAIRYLRFGPWGISAISVTYLVALIAVVASQPNLRNEDATLAFASESRAGLGPITQRILSDNPWTGIGAGTFAAIVPVYRDAGDTSAYTTATTAAATTVIELGRFMFLAIVVTTLVAIIALLRGALRRGRDSYYAAGGAGCLVTLLMIAFCNAGIYGTAISIIAVAALGLAFGQSRSRAALQSSPRPIGQASRLAKVP